MTTEIMEQNVQCPNTTKNAFCKSSLEKNHKRTTAGLPKKNSAIPEENLTYRGITLLYAECTVLDKKTTKHTKKQQGKAHSQDKKSLTENIPEKPRHWNYCSKKC